MNFILILVVFVFFSVSALLTTSFIAGLRRVLSIRSYLVPNDHYELQWYAVYDKKGYIDILMLQKTKRYNTLNIEIIKLI
jgi:hypothetical protein